MLLVQETHVFSFFFDGQKNIIIMSLSISMDVLNRVPYEVRFLVRLMEDIDAKEPMLEHLFDKGNAFTSPKTLVDDLLASRTVAVHMKLDTPLRDWQQETKQVIADGITRLLPFEQAMSVDSLTTMRQFLANMMGVFFKPTEPMTTFFEKFPYENMTLGQFLANGTTLYGTKEDGFYSLLVENGRDKNAKMHVLPYNEPILPNLVDGFPMTGGCIVVHMIDYYEFSARSMAEAVLNNNNKVKDVPPAAKPNVRRQLVREAPPPAPQQLQAVVVLDDFDDLPAEVRARPRRLNASDYINFKEDVPESLSNKQVLAWLNTIVRCNTLPNRDDLDPLFASTDKAFGLLFSIPLRYGGLNRIVEVMCKTRGVSHITDCMPKEMSDVISPFWTGAKPKPRAFLYVRYATKEDLDFARYSILQIQSVIHENGKVWAPIAVAWLQSHVSGDMSHYRAKEKEYELKKHLMEPMAFGEWWERATREDLAEKLLESGVTTKKDKKDSRKTAKSKRCREDEEEEEEEDSDNQGDDDEEEENCKKRKARKAEAVAVLSSPPKKLPTPDFSNIAHDNKAVEEVVAMSPASYDYSLAQREATYEVIPSLDFFPIAEQPALMSPIKDKRH